VLCKDRLFETFRSLYTQRPAQISVLRRSLGFNIEVTEYARISCITDSDHNMLAQEGIIGHIPGVSVPSVIKSPSTDPNCLHYITGGRSSYSFSTSLFALFSTLFQVGRACSCSGEGYQYLTNVRGSNVTIERYSHRLIIQ
jgi:hypothetical protein